MSVGYRSRSLFALKLCAQTSVTLVRVHPIPLSCIVGFENNVAQMILMAKQYAANKNHNARSKVNVKVCS